MHHTFLNPMIAGSACIGIISVLTLPAIILTSLHLWRPTPKTQIYEDKDGTSTVEKTSACTALVSRIALLIAGILGLLFSVSIAALENTNNAPETVIIESWLNTASSALILIQAVAISTIKEPVDRFRVGVFAASSCAILLLTVFCQYLLLPAKIFFSALETKWDVALKFAHAFSILLALCASLSIPRRPEVYVEKSLVDGQFTASAVGRLFFTWVDPLLSLAKSKKRLEIEDIPIVDHDTRAGTLVLNWENQISQHSVVTQILYYYRRAFASQWIFTILQSGIKFTPNFVTLKLLQALQHLDPGASLDSKEWMWVILLGLSSCAVTWVENWTFWLSWGSLAVRCRAQLSALIFQKALRCKDLKGVTGKESLLESKSDSQLNEKIKDGPKSTANLITTDTKNVSDFCAQNCLLPGSLFSLIIAAWFLQNLLGWIPLVSGFTILVVSVPISIFANKSQMKVTNRLMAKRDAKVAVIGEALNGIRQIKFSAEEQNWLQKITCVRNEELEALKKVYFARASVMSCYALTPIAISAASLSVYAYVHGGLDAATVFTALGVFNNVELALGFIPGISSAAINARTSVKRIDDYLKGQELPESTIDGSSISFEAASVAWPIDLETKKKTDCFVLRNVNLAFPPNELSVVSGKSGTGKSLLLAAIVGEAEILEGVVTVPRKPGVDIRRDDLANQGNWIIPSARAFVGQSPWVENASLKDNILFGLPLDQTRYEKVIEACALQTDIKILADEDLTELGANGVNLSGGQKWRVTFARALYSRAGTLILDDIFSAVDAHVGKHLLEKALTGELGVGRTRILVTHHVALCKSKAKYLVELGNGTVEHAGTISELVLTGGLQDIIDHEEPDLIAEMNEDVTAVNSDTSDSGALVTTLHTKPIVRKFVTDEFRAIGKVKLGVYLGYIRNSGGVWFWAFALVIFCSQEVLTIFRAWWLKYWTRNAAEMLRASSFLNQPWSYHLEHVLARTTQDHPNLLYYLGTYISISIGVAILGILRYVLLMHGSLGASRKMFTKLIGVVLRTPMRWHDTTPSGRVIGRFTTDFNTVDNSLAMNIAAVLDCLISLFGVVIAAMMVSPYVIILAAFLIVMCYCYCNFYLYGAMEIKRLEGIMKSPILEKSNSALTGLTTIRTFSKAPVYIKKMQAQIDKHSTCSWYICVTNRWVSLRMALMGNAFTFAVALVVAILPIDVSLAGFALTFASQYGTTVLQLARQYTNMEQDMNSAERIIEYMDLETEPQDGIDPPAAWPKEGRLDVFNLTIGYADDLPPVLKDLTFSVRRKERIGVVGRTGAGKSSLTLALFRFLEPRLGAIHIDGLDISRIKLSELRSRLAIIPQDPTLFTGTVRSNLDPFGKYSDLELRDALERVHLVTSEEFIVTPPNISPTPNINDDSDIESSPSTFHETRNQNPFASLSSPIAAGGLNLSQGQRQLLCLARAIVARPKIMVLDEATSAVDMATDTLLQRSIREEFSDSTLLVIAHRLSTIADFDKILVLENGKIVEFGPPKDLIGLEGGVFRSLVNESGEREKLIETIMGSR